MLIKIENGQPVGYPILEENFRYLFPKEVFPLVLTPAIVEPFGYGMYDFSQQPEINWDQERVEDTPVKDEFNIWRQQWKVQSLTGAELTAKFEQRRADLMRSVDRDVDIIYAQTIGSRATEYLLAETEARAYQAAGYTGAVPITVQEWADVKGWTAKQAADDVLAAADAWRTAQTAIRKNRLKVKDDLRNATSAQTMDTLMASWSTFVAAISQQLAD